MRCGNCGHIVESGEICPKCGIDIVVFSRAKNISIRLYNKGLSLAKRNDLSTSISLLEQSLLFDKKNIDARNLLGVIYCEVGRIAEGLRHWIVSASFKKEDNLSIKYIEFLQKNARKMELWNDSVLMYNKALEYLKNGSDDLAIIQLKKALDINPEFIDACNLMTLCCIDEKNYSRANQFIDTVLNKDCRNPFALSYRNHISNLSNNKGMRKIEKVQNSKQPSLSPSKKTDSAPPLPRYKRHEKNNSFIEQKVVFSFFAGIGITLLVIFVLWFPAIIETKDEEILNLSAQLSAYTGSTNMSPEEVLQLRSNLENLEAENKLLRSEETKQANLELLQKAISFLADKDYVNCVNIANTIETLGFSDEDLYTYNTIKATAYPEAANILYNQGKGEYLNNRFTEAKINLENALNYTTTENFIDDAYFYLGKIAEQNKSYEEARAHYTKILEEYPDSNQITNVQNSLQQLERVD